MRESHRFGAGVPAIILAILLGLVPGMARGQDTEPAAAEGEKHFTEAELDQLLAPIALYPDDLLSQVLMASTYPLEVVEASRWVKSGPVPEGDKLAKALEAKDWDASVKSLVNFPDVLEMMDTRLDWTQKLGNAFLEQEADVMAAVQRLRQQAWDEGNLKTTDEQKVVAEADSITIEPADPDVIYVPVYNTTVVYGTWRYPAYPPYYWYPPRYPRPTLYGFAAGVTVGLAWGYAWGRCSWHRSSIDIDINRNLNINRNIDRNRYREQFRRSGGSADGKGAWRHDPQHRRGVSYADRATAQRYHRGPTGDVRSRQAYRGRPATQPSRPRAQPTRQPTRPTAQPRRQPTRPSAQPRRSSSAFGDYNRGSTTRRYSSRGQASRQSYHRSSGARGRAGGFRGGRR